MTEGLDRRRGFRDCGQARRRRGFLVPPRWAAAVLLGAEDADAEGDDAQAWLKGLMSPDRVYFKAMRAYSHWFWPLPEAGLHKRAHRVKAPTLVIHGEADGLTTAQYAKTLAGMVNGARVETIAGASHLLGEDPQQAAALTIAHLQS